jgi:hypothetical protein
VAGSSDAASAQSSRRRKGARLVQNIEAMLRERLRQQVGAAVALVGRVTVGMEASSRDQCSVAGDRVVTVASRSAQLSRRGEEVGMRADGRGRSTAAVLNRGRRAEREGGIRRRDDVWHKDGRELWRDRASERGPFSDRRGRAGQVHTTTIRIPYARFLHVDPRRGPQDPRDPRLHSSKCHGSLEGANVHRMHTMYNIDFERQTICTVWCRSWSNAVGRSARYCCRCRLRYSTYASISWVPRSSADQLAFCPVHSSLPTVPCDDDKDPAQQTHHLSSISARRLCTCTVKVR